MKTRTIALATTFVISSSLAFAQTGGTAVTPAPERSGAPIAGPGPGGPAVGTTDPHG
jgi:hypothetical protein